MLFGFAATHLVFKAEALSSLVISFDLREFQAACRFVTKASRKDDADVLNKAALTAIIGGKGVKGAVQLTPKADLGKLRAARPQIIAHYMRLGFSKGDAVKRYNLRVRARGYTAGPGWHNTITKLGGRGVKRQSGFSRSKASHATGSRATVAKLVAELENSAPAATKIGREALQQGLNNAARDMRTYWEKRIQKTFNRVSR